jgi:DNA-binding FrmR family transcriptional regulator
VRGLQRLVEEDTYCIDILTQVSAVTKALQSVAVHLLDDHLGHCVHHAIITGGDEAQAKIADQSKAKLPMQGVSWNYTTWLNIAFLILAAVLLVRFLRTGGPAMLRMMSGSPNGHEHEGSHRHEYGHHHEEHDSAHGRHHH